MVGGPVVSKSKHQKTLSLSRPEVVAHPRVSDDSPGVWSSRQTGTKGLRGWDLCAGTLVEPSAVNIMRCLATPP
jgi:hypothetical protein